MALIIADRVRETSTTTGAGAFTLNGAVTGYQTFLSAIGAGNTCYYTISNPGVNEWEVGIGTVGSGTLTRTTLISSSTGSFVSFTSGSKDVFVTYPAEKAVYLDAANNITPSLGGATFSSITDTGLTANRVTYAGTGGLLQDSSNLTFDGTTLTNTGNAVISANSTSDALRITQLGTGNALLVEDSANPDASPFVIDANGDVLIGGAVNNGVRGSIVSKSTQAFGPQFELQNTTNDANSSLFIQKKDRLGAIVQNNDSVGGLWMYGYDGLSYIRAATIISQVDGTPGTNDMPGRLVFSTTADGASSPTERMRINSSGTVGIGSAGSVAENLRIGKNITGNTNAYGVNVQATVQSDVSAAVLYATYPATQATTFTLAGLKHFSADQGTFGLGSTVTNQFGFRAESSLTGATNNYGFYSAIASGTGRYNFYAAGTANNFLAGPLYLGQNYYTTVGIGLNYNSGAVTGGGILQDTTVSAATTSSYEANATYLATAASAFTLSGLRHFVAKQGTIGAGSTVTNQYGYVADGSLAGATNNYGFFGNIASGTGRWNFYAAGTADNYFAGNVGVGNSTDQVRLNVASAVSSVYLGSVSSGGYSAISFNRGGGSTSFSGGTIASPSTYLQHNYGSVSTSIGGVAGAESLRVTSVASAVNYVDVLGATTGASPSLSAQGSDAAINVSYSTKGTGAHRFYTNSLGSEQLRITHTASAVNYLNVTGQATGGGPTFSAQGSDTNISLNYISKGTGGHVFSSINGANIQFVVGSTASAVNYLQVAGGATGASPYIISNGSDANVGMSLTTKGTGGIGFSTNNFGSPAFAITHTASAVNYAQITGSATTGNPVLSMQGSDADIGLTITAKGNGANVLKSTNGTYFQNVAGANQFAVTGTSSAVNYLQVTGAATGGAATLSAQGSDTNIDLALSPKGTGNVRFGTLTANADAPITGYILIKDAAGNLRKLAVIA